MQIVDRTGFTILDFLSDVGGIGGLLFSGTSIILAMLDHNRLDNYLVSKLYKLNQGDCPDPQDGRSSDSDSFYKPTEWCGIRDYCLNLC